MLLRRSSSRFERRANPRPSQNRSLWSRDENFTLGHFRPLESLEIATLWTVLLSTEYPSIPAAFSIIIFRRLYHWRKKVSPLVLRTGTRYIALEECIYIISCSFLGDRSAGLQLPSWVLESAFVDLLSSLGQELSKIHGFSPGQLIPPDLLETSNYTRKLGLATPLTGFQLADYRLCSPDYLTTRLRSGIKQLFFNRKWI